MTEFVVVAPFLAIMMAATSYFRDMHMAKMSVARQARETTWMEAYNATGSCTTRGAIDGALGNLSDVLSPLLDTVGNFINLANLAYYPRAGHTSSTQVAGLTWLSGATVSSSSIVQCNEIDYGDGPHGLALGGLSLWWMAQW